MIMNVATPRSFVQPTSWARSRATPCSYPVWTTRLTMAKRRPRRSRRSSCASCHTHHILLLLKRRATALTPGGGSSRRGGGGPCCSPRQGWHGSDRERSHFVEAMAWCCLRVLWLGIAGAALRDERAPCKGDVVQRRSPGFASPALREGRFPDHPWPRGEGRTSPEGKKNRA